MPQLFDLDKVADTLKAEVQQGLTPSQAGRKIIEEYGLISVIDMVECFFNAFKVYDSDFTAAIFTWEPYEAVHGIDDSEFDKRLMPMIEAISHLK